jgi:hypothetical protein
MRVCCKFTYTTFWGSEKRILTLMDEVSLEYYFTLW